MISKANVFAQFIDHRQKIIGQFRRGIGPWRCEQWGSKRSVNAWSRSARSGWSWVCGQQLRFRSWTRPSTLKLLTPQEDCNGTHGYEPCLWALFDSVRSVQSWLYHGITWRNLPQFKHEHNSKCFLCLLRGRLGHLNSLLWLRFQRFIHSQSQALQYLQYLATLGHICQDRYFLPQCVSIHLSQPAARKLSRFPKAPNNASIWREIK